MIEPYFKNIAELIQQVGPKTMNGAGGESVFIECGPMQFTDGQIKGRVFGPFKAEDECHNYIAVKLERHRLENAKYHGTKGAAPCDDRTYMGHPMFQYRIMPGTEFFGRYLSQIVTVALQGIQSMYHDDEPEVFWPNKPDGEDDFGAILDEDEWSEDDGEAEV